MENQEPVLHQLQNEMMQNTLTNFKDMILTEDEKEDVIKNYIAGEKRKKDCVFGRKVRDTDPASIIFDRDEVLNIANNKKHYAIEMSHLRLEDFQRRSDEERKVKDYWDYQRMYNLLLFESDNLGVEFEYNDDNKLAVQALCFFLSGNERFETELGYSFQKGIMLRGKYGVGKTHMIRCLKGNQINPIHMMSMIDIKRKVSDDGHHYMGNKNSMIYLDDVGSEDLPILHYGTPINWFKEFIEHRYYQNEGFNKIILSTNLNIKELADKYSERVTDRIAEMFNIIDVKGSSKRIKKVKDKKEAIQKALEENNSEND